MVESTGLENRQACKRLVGSNPTPSAISYTDWTIVGGTANPPLKAGNARHTLPVVRIPPTPPLPLSVRTGVGGITNPPLKVG